LEALGRFQESVEGGREEPDVFWQIARTHHQFGRFGQAFDTYAHAAELFYADGKLDEVMEMIEVMGRLDPSETTRQAKLAELLIKLGKDERAIEKIEDCATTLLEERGDVEAFVEVVTRLLEVGAEREEVSRGIVDIAVTQARRLANSGCYEQAEMLLETMVEQRPDLQVVRKTLAGVLIEGGKTGRGVTQLSRLARGSGELEPELEQLLYRAWRQAENREWVEQMAREVGIDVAEMGGGEREEEWQPPGLPAAGVGLEEQTDPSREFSREDSGTAPGLKEETQTGGSADEERSGEELPESPPDRAEGTGWEDDAITVADPSYYRRLLAVLWYAESCEERRVVRVRSETEELARFVVDSGRILPAIRVDDEIYVDSGLADQHTDLTEELDECESELEAALATVEAHWSGSVRGRVGEMLARGLAGVVGREEAGELTIQSREAGDEFEARGSFEVFWLLRQTVAEMESPGGGAAREFYDKLSGDKVDAWLMTREQRGVEEEVWLPIRVTSEERGMMDSLERISLGVNEMSELAETVRKATDSEYPIVSSLNGNASRWVFVGTPWHLCCARVEGSRYGMILNRAVAVAEGMGSEQ
jgi:tetratricopeptide (TPR) repeat protein